MSDNYVFADVAVGSGLSASIHSQRATPDEIVAIAKNIWADVRASGVAENDNAGNDELLSELQEKYADFTKSFPLVIRWMVQARQFSAKALKSYLLQHANTDMSSRESFLRLQAEYLVLLHRASHPHADEALVKKYREAVIANLLEEDKAVTEIEQQVTEEFAARAAAADQERRARLYNALKAAKSGPRPAAGGESS